MAKTSVVLVFKAIDQATGGIRKVTSEIERLAEATGKANKLKDATSNVTKVQNKFKAMSGAAVAAGAAMSAALTLPIAALGTDLVKSAADFELGLADLEGRLKATPAAMMALASNARQVGISSGLGFRSAVEGMTALGRAGLDTNQILQSTKTALYLAGAEGIGTEQAADLLTDTANAFRLSYDRIEDIGNILGKSSDISSIKIQDLQNSLKYAAPMANQLGIELEDLAAAISTLGSLGIKGETGGTALRSFFTTLTGDAKDIEKLKAAGIKGEDIFNMGPDGKGNVNDMKDIATVLRALQPVLKDTVLSTQIFGKEFGSVIQILGSNLDRLGANTEKMNNRTDQLKNLADKKLNTFWGQIGALKAAFDDIGAAMARDGTLDIFTKFVRLLKGVMIGFNKASPSVKIFLVAMAGIAAIAGPIVMALGTMGFAFQGLAAMAGVFNLTILPMLGAFALLAIAVGTVSYAAILLTTRWDDLWHGLSVGVTDAKNWFKDLFDFTDFGFDKLLGKIWKVATWLPRMGIGMFHNSAKFFGLAESPIEEENRRASVGRNASGGLLGPFRNPEDFVQQRNDQARLVLDVQGALPGMTLTPDQTFSSVQLEAGFNGQTQTLRSKIQAGRGGR